MLLFKFRKCVCTLSRPGTRVLCGFFCSEDAQNGRSFSVILQLWWQRCVGFYTLGAQGLRRHLEARAVVSSHWRLGQSSTGCSFLRNRNLPCCYASFAFGFSLNVFYLHEMFALYEESRHICYGLLFFLLVSDSHKGRTLFALVKITALFWQLNVLLSFLFWKSGFSVSFLNDSSSISVLQSKPSLESSNLDSMRLKAFFIVWEFHACV